MCRRAAPRRPADLPSPPHPSGAARQRPQTGPAPGRSCRSLPPQPCSGHRLQPPRPQRFALCGPNPSPHSAAGIRKGCCGAPRTPASRRPAAHRKHRPHQSTDRHLPAPARLCPLPMAPAQRASAASATLPVPGPLPPCRPQPGSCPQAQGQRRSHICGSQFSLAWPLSAPARTQQLRGRTPAHGPQPSGSVYEIIVGEPQFSALTPSNQIFTKE